MTTKTPAPSRSRKPRSARPAAHDAQPRSQATVVTRARTETENRLWHALTAHPNTTATHLSSTARIGKSTAGKILVTWETAGTVIRTARPTSGAGRRTADLWAITPTPTTGTGTTDAKKPAATTVTTPRLAAGALRGMVEDYLAAHPGEEFSPVAISKALERSAGAVNNALEKLVDGGYATKIRQAPKRFTLAASAHGN